ncbi:MAG: DAK2 domain-containing protein [Corynebacterium sp.]|nr:DAK2 domain-containing protein [Corynebacterium sp.]
MISGGTVATWARLAAAALDREREEINRLNVFPIPDSDTGSNMAQTMAAAVANLDDTAEHTSAAQVASALAAGAVKGARGNSGVVLSQVLRGIAQAAGDEVSERGFIDALNLAVELVEKAIQQPVEGTVLTVLRAAAHAAKDHPTHPVDAACAAASRALAATPSQLPILAERGVVDAGGRGLVVTLNALKEALDGVSADTILPQVGEGPLLEVMFYFESADEQTFDAAVEALVGDSLMVARDSDHSGTIHLHTRRAGAVIEQMFASGRVSHLHIEVLPDVATQLVVPDEVAELFPIATAFSAHPTGACIYLTCGLPQPENLPHAWEIVPTSSVIAALVAASMLEEDQLPSEAARIMRRAAADVRVTTYPPTASVEDVQELLNRCVPETAEQVTLIGPGDHLHSVHVGEGIDLVRVESATIREIGVE